MEPFETTMANSSTSSIATPSHVDVLIVGAGPTGLTLATILSRAGVQAMVVDQQLDSTGQSRALGMHARSLEILRDLDASNEAITLGNPVNGAGLFVDFKIAVDLTFDKSAFCSEFPFMLILEQSKMERIMIGKLNAYGTHIHRLTRMEGWDHHHANTSHPRAGKLKESSVLETRIEERVEQSTKSVSEDTDAEVSSNVDGDVENPQHYPYTVTLRKLNSASIETDETYKVKAKYIVGCDGSKSFVRKQLGIPFDGMTYKTKFFVADAEVDWNLDFHFYRLQGSFAKKGFLVLFPMVNNVWRIITTSPVQEAVEPDGEKRGRIEVTAEEFTQHMKIVAPECKVLKLHWCSAYNVNSRLARTFQKDGIFICGDAAHVVSPVGGQGMNMGMQDAYNLGWKLVAVLKGGASADLLESYSAERRAVCDFTVWWTTSLWNFLINNWGRPRGIARFAIKNIMKRVSRSQWFCRNFTRLISMLFLRFPIDNKYIFKSSLLVKDLQPGGRFPYVSLERLKLTENNHFDTVDPTNLLCASSLTQHVLLLFVSLQPYAEGLKWDHEAFAQLDKMSYAFCCSMCNGKPNTFGGCVAIWVLTANNLDGGKQMATLPQLHNLPPTLAASLSDANVGPYAEIAWDNNLDIMSKLNVKSGKKHKGLGTRLQSLFLLIRPDGHISQLGHANSSADRETLFAYAKIYKHNIQD